MRPFMAPSLLPAFPEIFLAIMAMIFLLLGVVRSKDSFRMISNLSFISLIAVAAVVCKFSLATVTTFGGMFITDAFSSMMKVLVLAGSAMTIFMSVSYAEREKIGRFEYPVLVLFSTLGMMMMISANSLMSLYVALEMQSLPLYVLAAMQRDSLKSTEAGLKYFVLGALSSGMLLYGASLVYGYAGTTMFDGIAQVLSAQTGVPLGMTVGLVLLLSGLAFKLAAVPFHMWTPDVYEGAPTSVTAFFAIVPKIAALALVTRVLTGPFAPIVDQWQQIIILLSIASMILGSVAAIGQDNIKRLLAYSSIGHIGYALIGLAAANPAGVKAVIVYAALYIAAGIGTFAIVLMMKSGDRMVERIQDVAGLGTRQPVLAFAMAVMMFSMAGIPPLAGFFGKLFVFQAAIDAELYTLAIIGVLTSVIAAYYYLRIIKIMYFDAPAVEVIDQAKDTRLNAALFLSCVVLILFIAIPGPLLNSAATAAGSLIR